MSQRLRRRYIAIRIDSDQPLGGRDPMIAVSVSLLKLFGEYGASQAELAFIEYNPELRCLILRCSHKALDMVKASIAVVTNIRGEKAALHILYVSGTLRALRKRITLPKKIRKLN